MHIDAAGPSHGHSHGPGGHQHPHIGTDADGVRRLRIALVLTIVFLVAEIVGGILSNSLALLADAGHMFTDAAALGLSLFVAWFAQKPETPKRTYGYLRLEILAAFVNGATLLFLSTWILFEAVMRFRQPEPVAGGLMLVVALIGLLVNVAAAWTLHPSQERSLNMRGAYLHVVSDLLGSVGTVVAAMIIHFSGWLYADPIVSVLVTLLIVRGAWQLVRESVDVLLESTPAHISLGSVRKQLEAIPGIESVHDLHVWAVATNHVAMSAHALCRDPDRHQHVLEHVHDAMRLFGIHHVTIQIESDEMYERERHLHA